MSLITYTNLEDGTPVTANIFNERFAQIVAEINGKLAAANMLDGGITKEKLATEVYESLYPVGSMYVNFTDNTNPGTLLGFGTWTAVAGKFVAGYDGTQTEFNASEKTGGAKTHTHDLSDNGWSLIDGTGGNLYTKRVTVDTWTSNVYNDAPGNYAAGSVSKTRASALGGATDATDDTDGLPPYIVGYVWKRVS